MNIGLTEADMERINAINARIPGWSGLAHYAFFQFLLGGLLPKPRGILIIPPPQPRVLMLGVYHGRDLAYLTDVSRRFHEGRVQLTGVDKFSPAPCQDWPEEKRGLSWNEAGFGEHPTLEKATQNLAGCDVRLIAMDDADFLAQTEEKFDVIYLDTSHDYATVHRQLAQVRAVCSGPDTIICGDDYSDEGTWGVKRAVTDGFKSHNVFANWIWFSTCKELTKVTASK